MNKFLLTIEFRYLDVPKGNWDTEHQGKTITIGIYDTMELAIESGNESLKTLAQHFEVRHDDKFQLKFLFGNPKTLVTNSCYPTKGIQFFAKIDTLKFDDLSATIDETFAAFKRYKKYKLAEQEQEDSL